MSEDGLTGKRRERTVSIIPPRRIGMKKAEGIVVEEEEDEAGSVEGSGLWGVVTGACDRGEPNNKNNKMRNPNLG